MDMSQNQLVDEIIVEICVGSSCHMKGSHEVIGQFRQLIADNGLQDKVILKACFCMQRCMSGVSMTIDEKPVDNVQPQNCADIFAAMLRDKKGSRNES